MSRKGSDNIKKMSRQYQEYGNILLITINMMLKNAKKKFISNAYLSLKKEEVGKEERKNAQKNKSTRMKKKKKISRNRGGEKGGHVYFISDYFLFV